jgi:tRNA(Ile)-lysidine synthase
VLAAEAQNDFDLAALFAPLNSLHHIALAVSGGSDSMAMLHLVREWMEQDAQSRRITVLTVDHGLRAKAADEAAQVSQWCKEMHIPHVTLQWVGEKPTTGLQAKARQARYDLLAQWCLNHDIPAMLTAHTADDQAETVVMRQQRTSSDQSLAGIWPMRDWQGVRVVRPLLGLSRNNLRGFLKSRGVGWIDDPSNDDQQFERVRIRQGLKGDVAAAQIATVAQAHVLVAQASALAWLESSVVIDLTGLVHFAPAAFSKLTASAQDAALTMILVMSGAVQIPERKKRLALRDWLISGVGLRRCLGGVVFAKRRASILVGREAGRISAEVTRIPPAGVLVWDSRFLITGPVGAEVKPALHMRQIVRPVELPAFIHYGLPVVLLENGLLVAPYHGAVADAVNSCEFIGLKHVTKSWNYN